MIKKLDILILRSFVGPFLITFFIALFVLVMQFFWLYIDDLVGKGLDGGTILKLIMYVSITAVPLALPLALLISSIMTFGNLGESYELVAIKSAGISLMRFMRPLIIVAIGISSIAFLFANYFIPIAQLKLASLKYDVIISKPAFDIKEGVFYTQITGLAIKISKKENDDSTIRGVVVFEKVNNLQDNILMAESGVMRITPDKKYLEFILRDGWRYEEKGPRISTATDFIRTHFKEYKKILDLATFQLNKDKDTLLQYDPKMLSVRQLNIAMDTIEKMETAFATQNTKELRTYLPFLKYEDSLNGLKATTALSGASPSSLDTIWRSISFQQKMSLIDGGINALYSAKNRVDFAGLELLNKQKSMRQHQIEFHRKFTLSFACLILFLIGAPLGAIIRKGGLGMPMVMAIIFFVIFHLFNTFGEKLVKEEITSPFIGMWLSTMVLFPIVIFLIYKARKDAQLFNQEFYFRLWKKTTTIWFKQCAKP